MTAGLTAHPTPEPACAPAPPSPDRRSPPDPAAWRVAGQALVAKAIAELSYEQLLAPVPVGPDSWVLNLSGAPPYTFRARRGGFGSWSLDPASVRRGEEPADDPVQLVLDARAVLGLDGPTTGEVVRELIATHAADARIQAAARPAAALARLGYAELEQHLDGHPVLVLNKGRLGFSAADCDRYAPESHGTVRLRWYAVHRELARYAAVPGLPPARLLAEELGAQALAHLDPAQRCSGADAAQWAWLPVHPFQDEEVVRTLFAAEIARGRLVPLGTGPVDYRPVQSIRTLVAPGHRDVKTALLMRNTLVWRGLGADATAAAPDVSAWLTGLTAGDARFAATGLGVLREVASVVVRHPAFEAVPDLPYRYRELLGAVWREPVAAHLRPGERARSLAALLHVDPAGRSLLAELVDSAGVSPQAWLGELCDALLPGLLYYLTRHGVAFCPHGENAVIVYDDRNRPRRALVKDLAEDLTLLSGRAYPGLSAPADAVLVRWPAEELAHSILSAVFAGHFRFLAPVAADHLGVAEDEFWSIVRGFLLRWRDANPDLAEEFDALRLLDADLERVALNREHLTGGGFHDRAERDGAPDVVHGRVPNPLADPEVAGC